MLSNLLCFASPCFLSLSPLSPLLSVFHSFFFFFLPSGGSRGCPGTACRRGRASPGPRTQGPCSWSFFFFFLKGKVEVEERKESLRGRGSCSFGGLCFHASPPQLPSARPQRTRSCPAPSFFSSHERNLPLLPCSPTISDQRIKYGRGSQRGCEHQAFSSLDGGKKKKLGISLNSDTALSPPPTHRSDPSSPARRASSIVARLDCRARRSAAAMTESAGVRERQKKERRKRLCSVFCFLLSLSLFSLLFLLLSFLAEGKRERPRYSWKRWRDSHACSTVSFGQREKKRNHRQTWHQNEQRLPFVEAPFFRRSSSPNCARLFALFLARV